MSRGKIEKRLKALETLVEPVKPEPWEQQPGEDIVEFLMRVCRIDRRTAELTAKL